MSELNKNLKWPRLKETIVEDVTDYWDSFRQPLMLSRLGKRQQRIVKELGTTLVTVLRQMHKEKAVCLFITETMTRYIIPLEVREGMEDDAFMVWKAQFGFIR